MHQVTAAVGTAQLELVGCAGGAEGAFEGTNTRLGGIGRKVFVTTFARRPKFEHSEVLNLRPYFSTVIFYYYLNEKSR